MSFDIENLDDKNRYRKITWIYLEWLLWRQTELELVYYDFSILLKDIKTHFIPELCTIILGKRCMWACLQHVCLTMPFPSL